MWAYVNEDYHYMQLGTHMQMIWEGLPVTRYRSTVVEGVIFT